MKRPKSISLDEENLERLDRDKLSQSLGRSGLIRLALSEFYEKRETQKRESKNEKSEK